MQKNKRIGRNIGRIELLTVRKKVETMLTAGYDRKKIHDQLLEEGSVSMSYQTFCYQLKRLADIIPATSADAAQRLKHTGQTKTDQSESFVRERNPKRENLI